MPEANADVEEIWALVGQEGGENLALAEEALLKLETDHSNRDEIASLFRALHTFKGTARMMGLSTTETLAHHAEDLVALVRDDGVSLDAEIIDLLLQALDRLRVLLQHILARRQDVEPAQVKTLSDRLEETVRRKSRRPNGEEDPGPLANASADASVEMALTPPVETPTAPAGLASDQGPGAGGSGYGASGQLMTLDGEALEACRQLPVDVDETAQPAQGVIFAPVDLTADPEYVHFFLEMARGELSQLHQALAALAAGSIESLEQIRAAAEALQIATERMGYQKLLAELAEVLRLAAWPDAVAGVTAVPTPELRLLELSLLAELDRIQTAAGLSTAPDEAAASQPAALFRRWWFCQVEADLDKLQATIEELSLQAQQLALGGGRRQAALADELTRQLRRLYHSCVFQHLEPAAHLTLALEDLSLRVQYDEIPVTETWLDLFRTYVVRLREASKMLGDGQTPDLSAFEALVRLAEQLVCLAPGSVVLQVAWDVIEALDLPPAFKEVLTPENLAVISQVMQAGQRFYMLLADLDQDEAFGHAFLQWAQSGNFNLITNVTVFREQHSLFNFLVATPQPPSEVQEALRQLDPRGQYLTLTECGLRSEADLTKPPATSIVSAMTPQGRGAADTHVDLSAEMLAGLTEMVGELVADQSTVHQVVSRLADNDPVEAVLRLVETAHRAASSPAGEAEVGGMPRRMPDSLRRDLEAYWGNWGQAINSLTQTEVKLSAALAGLQEKTRALGLRPAAEMLDPLHRTAQALALRQGKQVTLDWVGAEVELDRRTLETLAEPLGSLVCYCIAESQETPEERRAAGKPVTGHVTITVTRTESHVQVVVEDDGRGRSAGIDLAALETRLRARQGKFTLLERPGQGLRFTLMLPLDLAVVDSMVVRVGAVRYVVPVHAIQRIIQPDAMDLVEATADQVGRLLKVEGKVLPVCSLLAPGAQPAKAEDQRPRLLVIVDKDPQPVALEVDELIGRQSVLVRPLPSHLAGMRRASGCALLGEGEVGMVLNLDML